MYVLTFAAEARRFYERSDAPIQRKLDHCFDILKQTPQRHPNIKRLKGRFANALRYRVGDFRVVYTINEQTVTVFVITIAHRSDVYD